MRSLEVGSQGFESPFGKDPGKPGFGEYTAEQRQLIDQKLTVPGPQRLWYIGEAVRAGYTREQIGKIDINEFATYVAVERSIAREAAARLNSGRIKGRTVKARLLANEA